MKLEETVKPTGAALAFAEPSVTTVIGSQDGRLPLTKIHEYVWGRLHDQGNCLCVHGWPIIDRWHWSSLLAMPWPHFALGACTNALALVYEWFKWYRKVFFIVVMWLKHYIFYSCIMFVYRICIDYVRNSFRLNSCQYTWDAVTSVNLNLSMIRD